MAGVELRGAGICKGDRGEPDTDKSRKPQANAAVNLCCIYLPTS